MSYPCQKIKTWKINRLMLYQVAFLNNTFNFAQILFWKCLFILHARVNFEKSNLKITSINCLGRGLAIIVACNLFCHKFVLSKHGCCVFKTCINKMNDFHP